MRFGAAAELGDEFVGRGEFAIAQGDPVRVPVDGLGFEGDDVDGDAGGWFLAAQGTDGAGVFGEVDVNGTGVGGVFFGDGV